MRFDEIKEKEKEKKKEKQMMKRSVEVWVRCRIGEIGENKEENDEDVIRQAVYDLYLATTWSY